MGFPCSSSLTGGFALYAFCLLGRTAVSKPIFIIRQFVRVFPWAPSKCVASYRVVFGWADVAKSGEIMIYFFGICGGFFAKSWERGLVRGGGELGGNA